MGDDIFPSQIFFNHALFAYQDEIEKRAERQEVKYKMFRHLAHQWAYDMILDIEWKGNKSVYRQTDFGTDMGICDWITPNTNSTELYNVQPGSETGSDNGLRLILDAETFDYGTRNE